MRYLVLCLFVISRVILYCLNGQQWLGRRIELSTPLNQWHRLTEGLTLIKDGHSPYEGDTCHEPPLVLLYFQALTSLGSLVVFAHYIIVDFIIAVAIWHFISLEHRRMVNQQAEEQNKYGKGANKLLIQLDKSVPDFAASLYLLNPLTILSTSSLSTVNLTNLFIILTLAMIAKGNIPLAALFLACSGYLSLYPLALLLPLILFAFKMSGVGGATKLIIVFTLSCAGLLGLSYYVSGSWAFLRAVYGVILLVPDLTPNFGLFWYFFTEMFDHFRKFFICVFQINVFILVFPLSFRFYDNPTLLLYLVSCLISVLKSYPCFGDILLPIALLPLWSHLYRNMRFTLVIVCMFLISTIVGPVFYHLWTSTGSINSNFFFALTLVYSLSQIFLISDVIHAYLLYCYDLKHGWPRVDKDGNQVKLKLS